MMDFQFGLEKIQCFTRWSKHGDLKDYADILEEWDDIVGDKWEEPETLTLSPLSWIIDTPTFRNKQDRVTDVVTAAFTKANQFLARFQPILEIYWRNKQFDINILVDEGLKNQVESLSHVMKLFKFYQAHFASNLPASTDIGLLQLDSTVIKNKLQPTPKEFNDKIEVLVPQMTRERTDHAKSWLSQSIQDLRGEVNNVEQFVVQQRFLNAIEARFQFVRDKIDLYGQFYGVLMEHALNKPRKEELSNHSEAILQINTLSNIIQNVQSAAES